MTDRPTTQQRLAEWAAAATNRDIAFPPGRPTASTITDTQLDQLHERLARVRAIHHPIGVVAAAEAGIEPDCAVCGPNTWPCPTYQAVTDLGQPSPAAPEAAAPCPGFPDLCPNPVDVPAQSPYHGGGIRCGCSDQKEN